MKTTPITPALLQPAASAAAPAPTAALHGDARSASANALALAQQVFLHGNQLPARWAGRPDFTALETSFGAGHNFLATWLAWRQDPQRCERLHVVALALHPLTRADLQRVHAGAPPTLRAMAEALLAAWPPLTPGLHALEFDASRVRLLLAWGDGARLLPGLKLLADAIYLDGVVPAHGTQASQPDVQQPRLLKAIARKAAPDATLAAASADAALRHGLRSAGFAVEPAAGSNAQRGATLARYTPAFVPKRPAAVATNAGKPRCSEATVIGAGLAGAAVAQALAQLGVAVTVFDQHSAPAQETSGNPAGLFHGTVHASDGTHARLYRTAALQAQRDHAAALAQGRVPGSTRGLLRLASDSDTLATMRALLLQQHLPPDYVQALDAAAASALAGVAVHRPAWFYPGGGWVAPQPRVQQALATTGVTFVGGQRITGLQRDGDGWLLLGGQSQVVARSSTVVLANAASAQTLLAALGGPRWPLQHTRGQVTFWQGSSDGAMPLQLPLAGDGYALPLPGGGLLCGATREAGSPDGDTRARVQDHLLNIDRLQRLTGLPAPPDPSLWQGRTGWRLDADDKLPIAGALPAAAHHMPPGQRLDQARLLPRESGLFVLTALGARGLTLAPLLGRLVAAMATDTPWPLEQDLADAVDPGRWLVRAARHNGGHRAASAAAAAAQSAVA